MLLDVEMTENGHSSSSSGYSDVHRSFLQTIANFGILEKNATLEILNTIKESVDETDSTIADEDKLQCVINEINERISGYHQKIIEVHYDKLDIDYYVFTNTEGNKINKQQNAFTMVDRKYFRTLLKAIAEDDNHSIENLCALNLSSELMDKTLTKKKAEELIEKWTGLGYFTCTDDLEGSLYLGPKGIVEFGPYLKVQYPEYIKKCQICEKIIFYGLSCEDTECTAIFHRMCVNERLKKLQSCFACKKPWRSTK